jgi:hypothetical protein
MTGSNEAKVVTPRDLHLLRELVVAKVLDREQIQIVCDIRAVNRTNDRLLRLHNAGFLRRHFLGTLAGGRKALYSLSPAGGHLVGLDKVWRLQRPENEVLVGDIFIAHQAAVNWAWIGAKYRVPSTMDFLSWLNFNAPLAKTVPLIPDGYFEFRKNGEILSQFIEVDLGTEGQRAWERKVLLYVKLAKSGEFSRLFSRPRFRVLVTAPSERRLSNIRQTVSKQTSKLFFFLDNQTINRDGLYSPLWLRPDGETKQPLI